MAFDITSGELNQAELESIVADEIARRKGIEQVSRRYVGNIDNVPIDQIEAAYSVGQVPGATAMGGLVLGGLKNTIQRDLSHTLRGEFQDIREDPALRATGMDQMQRTYANYIAQGNDPVEYFIDRPGANMWAAGQDPHTGDDVVFFDSTAPHPAVFAHELGHVQMNHSNDPLSLLQRSGLGRAGANNAIPLGAGGAIIGHMLGGRNRARGAALGGLAGTTAASGNFAYELGGASGRAMEYLPEDVDQGDAYGDLFRAGMTYGMAGPATAATAAVVGAGLMRPELRRFAGDAVRKYVNP